MKTDDELRQQVLNWIEIAEEDLRLAEHAFKMKSNIPYRLIGYHAQQAAEKYLKSFLVSRLIDFPYTHNIEMLVNLLSQVYEVKNELESTFGLSNYAIAKRYPGEYQKISLHESKEAVEAAKKIKETVLKLFKKDKFDIASITPYN